MQLKLAAHTLPCKWLLPKEFGEGLKHLTSGILTTVKAFSHIHDIQAYGDIELKKFEWLTHIDIGHLCYFLPLLSDLPSSSSTDDKPNTKIVRKVKNPGVYSKSQMEKANGVDPAQQNVKTPLAKHVVKEIQTV